MAKYFERELLLIERRDVRDIVETAIELVPEYFFHVPASSSGKYHPQYVLGEGGLYRHVRAVCAIAETLFPLYDFPPLEKDIIRGSCILHDGWKQGLDGSGGKTLHEHPMIASEVLRGHFADQKGIHKVIVNLICESIESHMGQWTTSKYSEVVLPRPNTSVRRFVHLCDYLASRKNIEVKLED